MSIIIPSPLIPSAYHFFHQVTQYPQHTKKQYFLILKDSSQYQCPCFSQHCSQYSTHQSKLLCPSHYYFPKSFLNNHQFLKKSNFQIPALSLPLPATLPITNTLSPQVQPQTAIRFPSYRKL